MTPDADADARTPAPEQPQRMFDLGGRTALVVGAGRPLGGAIALALAEAGADVAVAGLTAIEGEKFQVASAANQIWALGRRNMVLEMAATDAAGVATGVQRVDDAWGRIDVLVNAQDLVFAMPLDQTGLSDWEKTVAGNLTSVFLTCQAAGRVMLRGGYGRVINVVSLPGERGVANMAAYAAAKGGVLALTRTLAIEWAKTGVTANAVLLGWYEEQAGIADNPEYVAALTKMLPSRSLVKGDDAAALCVMLAADSGYMTGTTFTLDGAATSRI